LRPTESVASFGILRRLFEQISSLVFNLVHVSRRPAADWRQMHRQPSEAEDYRGFDQAMPCSLWYFSVNAQLLYSPIVHHRWWQ